MCGEIAFSASGKCDDIIYRTAIVNTDLTVDVVWGTELGKFQLCYSEVCVCVSLSVCVCVPLPFSLSLGNCAFSASGKCDDILYPTAIVNADLTVF